MPFMLLVFCTIETWLLAMRRILKYVPDRPMRQVSHSVVRRHGRQSGDPLGHGGSGELF